MPTQRTKWFAVLLIVFASCSQQPAAGGDPADEDEGDSRDHAAKPTSDIKVGIAFDIGGLGDQSFNDAAKRGLERPSRKASSRRRTPTSSSRTRRARTVTTTSSTSRTRATTWSSRSGSRSRRASTRSPPTIRTQFFGVVDGFAAEADERHQPRLQGGARVRSSSGAAAALKSEAGTIGFLGGQRGTGLIEKFEAGYEAGAQAVNPDIEVLVEYIGDSTAAFNDPTKGEALSDKMYDDGADVVYHASGASGAGLFKAAVEQRTAGDRCRLRPVADGEPGAAEVDPHLDAEASRHRRARHDPGRSPTTTSSRASRSSASQESGVDYAVNEFNDNEELLSSDIQAELDKFKEQIINGEITVPDEPEG